MTDLLTGRQLIAAAQSRWMSLMVLAVVFAAPLGAWDYSESSLDAEARVAMMASAGRWNPYVEALGTFHGSDQEFRYNSLTLGGYFRAAPWMKVGAFYRLQGGAHHLDDWTVIDNPGLTPDEQFWKETAGRYESLLLLDATPRILLPWIPGTNWVGAVKTRYSYNFRNSDQSLLVRPGLTWVMMTHREPVMNLSLQYALYFALNFGDAVLYGHGPYATGLYHLNDTMKLEGKVQYLKKTYAKTAFGGPWTLDSRHWIVGIGFLYTPDFRPSR